MKQLVLVTNFTSVKSMWTPKDSCVYKLSTSLPRPFLGFDFDDTLVHLRTSELRPNVKETLTTLNKDFNLVIFSNQIELKKIRQLMKR